MSEKPCMGIANQGYVPSEGGKRETDFSGVQILNLIPPKPAPQIGPFEPMSEYFVPIKHHKKLFRRSETLYVTKKENEKSRSWGCLLGGCSAILVAGIVTFALLAFLGQIPGIPGGAFAGEKQEGFLGLNQSQIPTSSESSSEASEVGSSISSITTISTESSTLLPITNHYLTNALDVEFSLDNGTFLDSLSNSSSSEFRDLAHEVEGQMSSFIRSSLGLELSALVRDFSSGGGIYVRMKIAWSEEAAAYTQVQVKNALRNLSMLGQFQIRFLKTFGVINLCNFSRNGCSHTCSFSQTKQEFICFCPDDLVLAEDGKTCGLFGAGTSPSVPATPPPSSASTSTSNTAVMQEHAERTTSSTPSESTTTTSSMMETHSTPSSSSGRTSGRSDLSTTPTTPAALSESSTTAATTSTTTTSTERAEPELTTTPPSSGEEEVTAAQDEELMTTELEVQETDTEGEQQYGTTIATVIIE